MKSKKEAKGDRIRIGEIVWVEFLMEISPPGLYRVEETEGDFLMLSAGEMRIGVSRDFIKITGRNLIEPYSWSEREIEILAQNACHCEDCRKLLEEKKEQIARRGKISDQPVCVQ